VRNGWVQGPARKRRTLEVSRQSTSKSAFAPAHKEDRRFQTRLKPSRAAGFVVTRDLARWEPGAWGLAAYPTQRPGRSRTLGVRPGSLLQVSLKHRSVSGAATCLARKRDGVRTVLLNAWPVRRAAGRVQASAATSALTVMGGSLTRSWAGARHCDKGTARPPRSTSAAPRARAVARRRRRATER